AVAGRPSGDASRRRVADGATAEVDFGEDRTVRLPVRVAPTVAPGCAFVPANQPHLALRRLLCPAPPPGAPDGRPRLRLRPGQPARPGPAGPARPHPGPAGHGHGGRGGGRMTGTAWDVLIMLVKVVGVFAALMVTVLLTIWLERRIVAFMQTRVGPNRGGPFGVLQTLADGIKLFFKEDVRPSNADRILYAIAPVIMMIPAFLAFSVIAFGLTFGSQRAQLTDLNVGLLFVLAMGSLQVYGIVLAGWASGSNYPLLGAVRSSAQMISYEIAQGLSLVGGVMYAGALAAAGIVAAQKGDPLLGFIPRWCCV